MFCLFSGSECENRALATLLCCKN
uniref:Uncharacterized protein n=1 Tax=Rhizophora mucronata TaxID=61149 RepID=A0A2P2PS53_RHIMU